jgi:UDP-N-acetylglucosamine transferase subunit ALG13
LFSFDRLTKAVDEAVKNGLIHQEIFAQIGKGGYKPQNFEWVEILDKDAFDQKVTNSSALLSHAGMGSISMAINNNKPLLIMPRLKKFGEHVNDHQLGTARKFEELGHVLVAYDASELHEKIKQLQSFCPKPRQNQAEAIRKRVHTFLKNIKSYR